MHDEYDHLRESADAAANADGVAECECGWEYAGPRARDIASAHAAGEQHAVRFVPADRYPDFRPGDRVLIEVRTRHLTTKHIVTIRSIEQRDGFRYVGWVNQPWDRDNGHWGYFRDYPTPQPFGTRVLEVIR